MTPRTLAILVVAGTAIGLGGYFLSDSGTPPPVRSVEEGSLVFPGLAARLANAQRIEVSRQGTTLVIAQRDGRWGVADRGGYPVRPEKVREILTGLTELRFSERRTADAELLERLGLEDPAGAAATSHLLRVLDGQGNAIAELIVGRRRVRTQGNLPESVYLRRPGETQAWLAEGRLPVDNDRQLWFDRDVANITRERIARVVVQRDGTELVFVRRDDRLVLESPADAGAVDDYKVEDITRAFEFLSFTDVLPESELPGEAIGSASFTLTDGVVVTARLNRRGEEIWTRFAATGEGEAAAPARELQARFAGWAFQLGPWKEAAFTPTLAMLRPSTPPAGAPDAPPTEPAAAPAPADAPETPAAPAPETPPSAAPEPAPPAAPAEAPATAPSAEPPASPAPPQ